MLDNWQRLERVIKWTGLSVNSFALTIGLKRSENLYQIKKGNNGISRDLAELIASKYPALSKGWLLTGEGSMFIDTPSSSIGVPYYGMDALMAIVSGEGMPDPSFLINLPIFAECDLAALCLGSAMHPEIPAGSIVMLKYWRVEEIIPGESYAIITPHFKGIRVIRQGESPSQLRLIARNAEEYDAVVVERNNITRLCIIKGVIVKKNT